MKINEQKRKVIATAEEEHHKNEWHENRTCKTIPTPRGNNRNKWKRKFSN